MKGYVKNSDKTIYITNGQKVKNRNIACIILVVLIILTAVSGKVNNIINLNNT